MPRRTTFLLIFLFALCLSAFASPQRSTFRISGTVVDSATGQPLDHSEVSISSTTSPGDVHTFLTSSDGRFLFANLAAGKYALAAARSGYVRQNFQQHENFSTAIVTGPGQNSENVRFPLARSALITGTVTDEWGDPVRRAEVLLFSYGLSDGSRAANIISRTLTNDLGQYRFAHLLPGTYTILVSARPWYAEGQSGRTTLREASLGQLVVSDSVETQTSIDSAPNPVFDVVYPLVYYPNAQSLAEAGKLSLVAGGIQTADYSLRPIPSIHLLVRTPVAPSGGENNGGGSDNFSVDVQRTFGNFTDDPSPTIKEVSPGLTELSGISPGEVTVTASGTQNGNFFALSQTLDLSSNRELDFTPHGVLSDISGVVLLAGTSHAPKETAAAPTAPEQSPETQSEPGQFTVVEASQQDVEAQTALQLILHSPKTGQSFNAYVSANGIFTMAGAPLPSGSYELSFLDLPTLQVTSIDATGAKASGRAIEITSGQPVKLTIHTAEAKGAVTGIALKGGKPFAGAMLVLVPQDPDQNPSLFHRDQSDSDGSFLMSPIFPGRYTLLAIENGWDLEWASAAVLFKYLPNGIPVDLKPDSTATFRVAVQ